MARTIITSEMIKEINELYYVLGVKAQVARELGISPSTVSKYIVPNYVPLELIEVKAVDLDGMRKVVEEFVLDLKTVDHETILHLTEEEVEEVKELWKELNL